MRITRLNYESMCLAVSFALTSCLSLFSLTTHAAGETPAALLGFQRLGNTLEFTVISTGCTTEEHFRLDVINPKVSDTEKELSSDTVEPQHLIVTLVRTQKDRCRRMPGPRVITLDIPELYSGYEKINIANPFVSLRSRG